MGQQCAPEPGEPNVLPPAVNQPQVTLHTNQGDIVIELFMHQAPTAAANFLHYLQEGYYDDAIFHDTNTAGIAGGEVTTGLSPKAAKPLVNESNNGLANLRGRVALYGPEGVASGAPSFIINLEDNPSFDYSLAADERVAYTVIGRVVQGMNIAKAIGALETTSRGAYSRIPATPVSVNNPSLAQDDYVDTPDTPHEPDDPQPATFSLSNASSVEAGVQPHAMACEDLDGDGDKDLAVANRDARQVVILTNDGNGAFAASDFLRLEATAASLAVADFDGDGHMDILAVSRDANQGSMLRGGSEGAFEKAVTFDLPGGPMKVHVSDVDGDAMADIVYLKADTDEVAFRLNTGDGTFGDESAFATSLPDQETAGVQDITVVQLEPDQDADLVVLHRQSKNLSVLLDQSFGTFYVAGVALLLPPGSDPVAITSTDLDKDGRFDIIVANRDTKSLTIFPSGEDGSLQTTHTYELGIQPSAIDSGDLDGDGNADLVVTGDEIHGIFVLLGRGDHSFAEAQNFPVGGNPSAVIVQDLDGDTLLDLAIANPASDDVSIYLNTTTGAPDDTPERAYVLLDTTLGEVTLEVLVSDTPVTSANFLDYVDSGFYDGTIFHRVIPELVVQGGLFLPGDTPREGLRDPIVNEYSPDRSNARGTVAMAKLEDAPNSATSQFFFNLADNSLNLDNQNGGFTVFARVVQGMDVVDAMATAETEVRSAYGPRPETPVTDIILLGAGRVASP